MLSHLVLDFTFYIASSVHLINPSPHLFESDPLHKVTKLTSSINFYPKTFCYENS